MKIHTETFGQGADMVLIHGWGYSSVIFKDMALKMSKLYRVTLIDLPGYGKSPANEEPLDESLHKLVLALPTNAILVGWSLGGLICLKLALLYPSRFVRIITIATNPCFVAKDNWSGVRPDLFTSFEMKLNLNRTRLLSEFTLLQIKNTKNQKKLYQLIKNLVQEDNLSLNALKNGLKFLNHTDLRSELRNLSDNTLFILSDNDSLIPKTVANELITLNPEIKVKIIEGVTHIPFLTQSDQVIKIIHEFCN